MLNFCMDCPDDSLKILTGHNFHVRCGSCSAKKRHKEKPMSDDSKEKMSISAEKRYEDPREREKLSRKSSGPNSHLYIDGRSSEYDNPQLRPEHKCWAKKIRKRDKYTCQLCGKEGWNAHHIDYDKDNFEEDNGICLCRKCHAKTNMNREIWTEFFQILINIDLILLN